MTRQIDVEYLNRVKTVDFPTSFENLKKLFKEKFYLNDFKYNNMYISCVDKDGDNLPINNEQDFLGEDAQVSKNWYLIIFENERKATTELEGKILSKKQVILKELEIFKKNLFKESCIIIENKMREKNKEHEEKINKMNEDFIENLNKVKTDSTKKTKDLLNKIIKEVSEILKEKLNNLNDDIKSRLNEEAKNLLGVFQKEMENFDFKDIGKGDSEIKEKIEQAKKVFINLFQRVNGENNKKN